MDPDEDEDCLDGCCGCRPCCWDEYIMEFKFV